MTNQLTKDLPVGDIQFYDNYVPALTAGNWHIKVDHTLLEAGTEIADQPLDATQEFIVSAPQFSMDQAQIINKFPPTGSTGLYGEVLPHLVLKDPMLPWERAMSDTANPEPWLALLVFSEDELLSGTDNNTQATATTVGAFMAPTTGTIKPNITKEDDIEDSEICAYIQIPVDVFKDIAPRLDELRFLSHCRQINTSDKAALGLNQHGLFSVAVANRFPERPAPGEKPRKSIVHLVSVEGFDDYLVDAPAFAGNTSVTMLSLASWTFQCLPDNSEDFRGLFESIVTAESAGPEQTWLRLPPTDGPSTTAAETEASTRLSDGFAPLSFHTRTGEQSFGWYRGPLTPVFTTALDQSAGPFSSSDAALIYDKAFGVFDFSLAAGWQMGLSLALADRKFGQDLMAFRRKGHRITDNLFSRLISQHFSATDIQALNQDAAVEDEFIKTMSADLLANIGTTTAAKDNAAAENETAPAAPPADAKSAVAAFLAEPANQAAILDAVKEDLEPIVAWISRLALLYPVPFDYLVADGRMLPVESLRFFYLDRNWINALIDGAISIGTESSRDSFYTEMTHGLIKDAAMQAIQIERANLLGIDPAPSQMSEGLISGFLLRSALVSGWPNLAVRPKMNGGDTALKILRLDHLSPTVLFCLVEGVPDYFEFSEPQEGMRFGVDDDGLIPLRNLVPPQKPGDLALGVQLPGAPFEVRDLTGKQQVMMRAAGSRVLNIAPTSLDGLIAKLTAANAAASKAQIATLSPASFAMQMVKAPEAIKFQTPK